MQNNTTNKRRLEGVVVSDKMTKTAVVEVVRTKSHPKYRKFLKISSRLKAQNENNEYKTGEKVIIEETRPLSKEKKWRIVGRSGTQAATDNNKPA